MVSETLTVGAIPGRYSTRRLLCCLASSTNQRFNTILRWLIPGKPRFDSSIGILGTGFTHSQFIRNFVNGFWLPCGTGSAAIEVRQWIGRLSGGAIYARLPVESGPYPGAVMSTQTIRFSLIFQLANRS